MCRKVKIVINLTNKTVSCFGDRRMLSPPQTISLKLCFVLVRRINEWKRPYKKTPQDEWIVFSVRLSDKVFHCCAATFTFITHQPAVVFRLALLMLCCFQLVSLFLPTCTPFTVSDRPLTVFTVHLIPHEFSSPCELVVVLLWMCCSLHTCHLLVNRCRKKMDVLCFYTSASLSGAISKPLGSSFSLCVCVCVCVHSYLPLNSNDLRERAYCYLLFLIFTARWALDLSTHKYTQRIKKYICIHANA